jgi:predicted ATPase
LTLVGALAASPDRDALELQLLNPLGTAYIAARGYAAPEVGPVFQRARELCERIGQPAQLFAVMWGGLVWRVVRGELGRCPALAAEAVALAERANDPGMLMEALFLSAATSVCRGEFAAAQAQGIRGLELDDRDRTRSWAAVTGQDSGVSHRSYLAIARWHLGQSDQALRISQEAIALARAIGQPFTLAFALDHCALLCLQCRLAAEARAVAEEEIAIVTEQGFRHWLATATLYTTDALVNEGRWAEALPLFERELDDLRATGNMLGVTAHLGFLGTAHTQAGNFEDGARALDEAFALAEKTEATFYEPELHRLRGELHLAETNDQPTAEACFHTAIARARRQQSKAWELRASTSLARLWQRQGRRDEARATLAEVYGSYTEGFTTPDLIDARALLESLAERAGR